MGWCHDLAQLGSGWFRLNRSITFHYETIPCIKVNAHITFKTFENWYRWCCALFNVRIRGEIKLEQENATVYIKNWWIDCKACSLFIEYTVRKLQNCLPIFIVRGVYQMDSLKLSTLMEFISVDSVLSSTNNWENWHYWEKLLAYWIHYRSLTNQINFSLKKLNWFFFCINRLHFTVHTIKRIFDGIQQLLIISIYA